MSACRVDAIMFRRRFTNSSLDLSQRCIGVETRDVTQQGVRTSSSIRKVRAGLLGQAGWLGRCVPHTHTHTHTQAQVASLLVRAAWRQRPPAR